MDDFPKWLLRIVGVIGLIAFGTTYAIRHDWSRGWMPSANPDYAPPPVSMPEIAAPAAPSAAPAPQAGVSVQPSAPAAAAPPAASSARAYVPCQPIGRTARGELVYSMDCRMQPAQ
ncbi:hypothetical protein [Rhodopseudomonas pseudopalustris]|uniref:Uncharacterized protein n=1 Tax=Rhodopseudomonas pseudopalustris TaxID=1513892 RepID=A0A1H8T915_9BRAD|nr:hypothetical protein [Rhodopseudomonas pseudopalustris]MBB1091229.1 hypothetical protein [Rhodopseudomonas palustris]SEO87540.1 hypothetical protein SAMN05444123_105290 [Rhodopseudomonas pseudopalustris]